MPIDDDEFEGKSPVSVDPHGQASLLLSESLIYILRERGLLTNGEAVEVVTTAMEVQRDVAEAADGTGERMWQSYTLLSAIARSLQQEVRRVRDTETPIKRDGGGLTLV